MRLVRTLSPGLNRSVTGHLPLGQHTLLGQQHRDRAEPQLVIRRRQVLLGRYPLDRVPDLVAVVDTAPDTGLLAGQDARAPLRVKPRLVAPPLTRRHTPPPP